MGSIKPIDLAQTKVNKILNNVTIYPWCCVFQPESWSKHFFQPFIFFSNLFQWFHIWNHWKTPENERNCVFSMFCYSSKLVDTQTMVDSLRGTNCVVNIIFNNQSRHYLYFFLKNLVHKLKLFSSQLYLIWPSFKNISKNV